MKQQRGGQINERTGKGKVEHRKSIDVRLTGSQNQELGKEGLQVVMRGRETTISENVKKNGNEEEKGRGENTNKS